MFDRNTVVLSSGRTQHHDHHVTVKEHRAPTDESVKLLREMEQAARDNVLASYQLTDNLISGVVEVVQDPMKLHPYRLVATLKINGKIMQFAADIKPSNVLPTQQEMAIALLDALSEGIAKELLNINLHDSIISMLDRYKP